MKKGTLITALIVSAIFLTTPCFATPLSNISLLRPAMVDAYASPFTNGGGTMRGNYARAARDSGTDVVMVAGLGGDPLATDTPLEIAVLASSVGVINIAPVEAGALGTPRQTDLMLGAALYQESLLLRFLGNTNAAGIHEGVLQHVIIARGNVTRAEVESFYRNNIEQLVSEIVDEQYASVTTGYASASARISATDLIDIKNALTRFMLAPNDATYTNLLRAYSDHGTRSGYGGMVIGWSVEQISPEVSRALLDNRPTISQYTP